MTMLVGNYGASAAEEPAGTSAAVNEVAPPSHATSRLLHPAAATSTAPLDTDALTDIVVGLARTVRPLDADGFPEPVLRRQILATSGYDVWVMHWAPGSEAAVHDHDGSVGVVHVVEGYLEERRGGLGGVLGPGVVLPVGSTATFGVHEVHELRNRSSAAVTSVHVYSPPLGQH